jgi:hypothetical protein
MPKPEQLPEDIKAITTKNALPLRHGAIAVSILMLIATLAHYWILARPLSDSITGPVTMLILIAAFGQA